MQRLFSYIKFLESVGNLPISDESRYVNQMSRSYIDKLFFMDQVDADVIVDFGCADGFILSKIKMLKPDIMLVGYDVDENMIAKASSNIAAENLILTSDWKQVESIVKGYNKSLLLLSSVIHEVYSYSNTKAVKDFWENKVFGGLFTYICIRDMIPSRKIYRVGDFQEDVKKIKDSTDEYYLKSFEERWGKISSNYGTFIHFLLKYRYKENWDREVEENYVPLSLETLYNKIPSNYKIILEDNYIYSYLQQIVKEDFGITIRQATHTKMILRKK
jgi:hypothetical protein